MKQAILWARSEINKREAIKSKKPLMHALVFLSGTHLIGWMNPNSDLELIVFMGIFFVVMIAQPVMLATSFRREILARRSLSS